MNQYIHDDLLSFTKIGQVERILKHQLFNKPDQIFFFQWPYQKFLWQYPRWVPYGNYEPGKKSKIYWNYSDTLPKFFLDFDILTFIQISFFYNINNLSSCRLFFQELKKVILFTYQYANPIDFRTNLIGNIYMHSFLDRVDKNKYLLCFNNGVFNPHTLSFNKSSPQYYQINTVNYDYLPIPCPKMIKQINTFMEQIFPIYQERENVWAILVKLLFPNTTNRSLFILNNEYHINKSSGKSTFLHMITSLFGDYHQILSGLRFDNFKQILHKKIITIQQIDNNNNYLNSLITTVNQLLSNDTSLLTESDQTSPLKHKYICNIFIENLNPQLFYNSRFTNYIPIIFRTEFVDNPDPKKSQILKSNTIKYQVTSKKWSQNLMAMLIQRLHKNNKK